MNATGQDIAGKRVEISWARGRVFVVNDGADAGFGSFMCCGGSAVFGKWEDTGENADANGRDIVRILPELGAVNA